MTLWLSQQIAERLVLIAAREAPREACGILAGRDGRVLEVSEITNVAQAPERAYSMDERELISALFAVENRGLDVLAFYHSHPSHEPIPSQLDIHLWQYPDVVMLIISLAKEPKFAAWQIKDSGSLPIPVHIGEDFPSPRYPSLSNGLKLAIIISAVVALLFVITTAVSLLPPAPPIPPTP